MEEVAEEVFEDAKEETEELEDAGMELLMAIVKGTVGMD
jgi:hypothetical protein